MKKRYAFGIVLMVAAGIFAIVLYSKRRADLPRIEIGTAGARVAIDSNDGLLTLSQAGGDALKLHMSFAVGETVRAGIPGEVKRSSTGATIHFHMNDESGPIDVDLDVRTFEDGKYTFDLSGDPSVRLSLSIPVEPKSVFVPETGELDAFGSSEARFVVSRAPHLVAFASREKIWASVSLPVAPADGENRGDASTRLVLSGRALTVLYKSRETTTALWKRIFSNFEEQTAIVRGNVSGQHEKALVTGLDDDGRPQIQFPTDKSGAFEVAVPPRITQWFAAEGATERSPAVRFPPGTEWPLRLDIAPGGELSVTIADVDTGAPLTARLYVHGVEGTFDPSFGPDYKASGAGPLIDVARGRVRTPLPRGKYVVSATKGIEYSIDRQSIEIESGKERDVSLLLRHVIPTPRLVGCDLHVHARPSFDSPVTVEDRVLSLISAGVDFAVPTEHNIVGDYAGALQTLDMSGSLSSVTGVEVTTSKPEFGHFGVFPYPAGKTPPPSRATTPSAVFAAAHSDPHRILQVNHPRLSHQIGYFDVFGFDPKATKGAPPAKMRLDFDALEVYNGYEAAKRERVEIVLKDFFALLNRGRRYVATGSSDSHRVQYQWAGYPRTYAEIDGVASGEDRQAPDPLAVVERLKTGHSFVTSGPILDFTIGKARPGDDAIVSRNDVRAHLRVRAASWIDVTGIEIVAGGQSVFTKSVASRPSLVGRPERTKEADAADAVRFDEDISFKIPEGAKWVVAIVRGERLLQDVLAFMPIAPFSFTNPIWIKVE